MSEKLSVTIKQSRWRAKIVTSLLPQPSVLAFRANFKTVTVHFISGEQKTLLISVDVFGFELAIVHYFFGINL